MINGSHLMCFHRSFTHPPTPPLTPPTPPPDPTLPTPTPSRPSSCFLHQPSLGRVCMAVGILRSARWRTCLLSLPPPPPPRPSFPPSLFLFVFLNLHGFCQGRVVYLAIHYGIGDTHHPANAEPSPPPPPPPPPPSSTSFSSQFLSV